MTKTREALYLLQLIETDLRPSEKDCEEFGGACPADITNRGYWFARQGAMFRDCDFADRVNAVRGLLQAGERRLVEDDEFPAQRPSWDHLVAP